MDENRSPSTNASAKGQQFVRQMLAAEKRIYAFILTLVGHPSDAEDILQETAALMWSKYSDMEGEIRDFTAWAIRIAHFKVLEYRKKQYRSRIRFTDEVFDAILGGAVSVNENLHERTEALRACLEKLPAAERELILLKHDRGTPAKAIAEKLHMSVDRVYKAVPRIHDILLRCVTRALREQGLT